MFETQFCDQSKDSVDLHIKHICILISWFFAHNLHFAIVFLQVLIKCSNSWHLWHWLIRLFRNFVTCKDFSLKTNLFWLFCLRRFWISNRFLQMSASCFLVFQFELIRSIHVQALNRCMFQFLFEIHALSRYIKRFRHRVRFVRIILRSLESIWTKIHSVRLIDIESVDSQCSFSRL